jgi:hypothetical protein
MRWLPSIRAKTGDCTPNFIALAELSDNGFLKNWLGRTIRDMRTRTKTPDPGAEIWQRVVDFRGAIGPSAARALLKIEFSERD